MEQKKFMVITPLMDITDLTINQAERIFFAYKDKKIITDCVFADDQWFLTDEYANYTFDFKIAPDDYKQFGEFIGLNLEDFKLYQKTFVTGLMGSYVIGSIRNFIHDLKKFVICHAENLDSFNDVSFIVFLRHISDFFSVLPSEGREKQLDKLLLQIDDIQDNVFLMSPVLKKQRMLATFDSYFLFNDILKKFWTESQDIQEKIFFFPLWFWWNISGVLPMRPREVLLTQRNCLSVINGKTYLTIRKNKIKGSGRTKEYKIDGDYTTFKTEIPEYIAKEIQWYINATNGYMDNELRTLFVSDPHYIKWERSRPSNSRYYTYINLRTCLRYFYGDIICGRYGYHIVDHINGQHLGDNEINYLHLGDTRHIALINSILEGANPAIAAVLAGQDRPEVTAHYYSNITELIECKTYRQLKSLAKGNKNYVVNRPSHLLNIGEFITLEDDSRCYSKRVSQGDFSDCYKVCGPAGEIGYCPDCTYHRSNGSVFRDESTEYKNRIMLDCDNLTRIIEKVRKSQGSKEEILQALLKLSGSSYSYQQFLYETTTVTGGCKENG
mgnify:CR=1 FL=1